MIFRPAVMCNAAVKSKFPVPVFLTNSSIQISSPIVRGVGRAEADRGGYCDITSTEQRQFYGNLINLLFKNISILGNLFKVVVG